MVRVHDCESCCGAVWWVCGLKGCRWDLRGGVDRAAPRKGDAHIGEPLGRCGRRRGDRAAGGGCKLSFAMFTS